MLELFNTINQSKVMGATILTFITGICGGWDLSIQVLLIAIAIDVVSGIYKGAKNGDLSSKRIREGMMTKTGYLLVLVLVYQFDLLVGNKEPIIRTLTAWLYIFTETVSVFENLYEVGVPIPRKLYDVLMAVKDKAGGIMTEEDFEDLHKNPPRSADQTTDQAGK